MTCKDCIHYDVCLLGACINGATGTCLNFKDKSRFIELPCKVGDTVYRLVQDKRIKHPYEYKVVGFWYSNDENCNNAHLVRYVSGVFDSSISVPFSEFGKFVFLSQEEAEKH